MMMGEAGSTKSFSSEGPTGRPRHVALFLGLIALMLVTRLALPGTDDDEAAQMKRKIGWFELVGTSLVPEEGGEPGPILGDVGPQPMRLRLFSNGTGTVQSGVQSGGQVFAPPEIVKWSLEDGRLKVQYTQTLVDGVRYSPFIYPPPLVLRSHSAAFLIEDRAPGTAGQVFRRIANLPSEELDYPYSDTWRFDAVGGAGEPASR